MFHSVRLKQLLRYKKRDYMSTGVTEYTRDVESPPVTPLTTGKEGGGGGRGGRGGRL